MSDKKTIQTEEDFNFEDVLDLSVTELLILQFLVRYEVPIVRIVLLNTLNALFTSDPQKKIGTSSFYHRLDKLETRGFISKMENQKIEVTTRGRIVINEMHRITAMASVDSVTITQDIMPSFLKEAQVEIVPNMLIINLEEGFDIRMIQLISQQGEEVYIVANDDAYQNYLSRDMNIENVNIKQTKHVDGKIREANDFFEAVVITGYDCNIHYEKHETIEWLKEAMRVLKPGGLIVVSSTEELPESNHFLVSSLIKNITESHLLHRVGQNELIVEMKSAGIAEPKIHSKNGIILGYGHKLV